MMVKEIFLE